MISSWLQDHFFWLLSLWKHIKRCTGLKHRHPSQILDAPARSIEQLHPAGVASLPGQHFTQKPLQSHNVDATIMLGEKMAVAAPFSFIEAENMIVILPPEEGRKGEYGHTFRFFCITLGFLDLADVTGTHVFPTHKV